MIFRVANSIPACFFPPKVAGFPICECVFFGRFSFLGGLCFVDFDKWASPRNATTIHLRSLFPIAMAIKHLLNFVFLKWKETKFHEKNNFIWAAKFAAEKLIKFSTSYKENLYCGKYALLKSFSLFGANNLMMFCFISLLWAMNLAGFGRAPAVWMMYAHHQKNG